MENIEGLRSKLVQRIFSTNNADYYKRLKIFFLQPKLKRMINISFSESQKPMLMMAEEDLKYGRTITDE